MRLPRIAQALVALAFLGFPSAKIAVANGPPPVVIGSNWGKCYAKSVPPDSKGRGGGTRVFLLDEIDDKLLPPRLPWYSGRLAVECDSPGRSYSYLLVRMGRGWKNERGRQPRAITLSFYRDGRLLAEYSRMDLARVGRPYPDTALSWMGYFKPLGITGLRSNMSFEICTLGGRILAFDITTGAYLKQSSDRRFRCERQYPRPKTRPDKIPDDYN